MASSSVIKHKKGKPMRSGQQRCVLNLFQTLCAENPTYSLEKVAEMTGKLTGVGKASVYRIRREAKMNDNKLKSPVKFRKTVPLLEKYDEFTKSAIRSKVHQFFFRQELPTLDKILAAVNGDEDNSDNNLPKFSRYVNLN